MAEEYLKLLDEARKKFARGEDATDLIPKITEALAKMSKEAREAALKSPGLTPEEANTELGVLWLEATLAWIAAEALALVGSYIPFTNAAPTLVKALDAPELKWRVDAALKAISLKTDLRLLAPLTRYFNKEYLPAVMDPRSTLQLLLHRNIGGPEFYRRMSEWGFSNAEADLYQVSSQILPGVSDRVKMMWRGLITADQAKVGIGALGYNYYDNVAMFDIQEPIPGSGDLVTMVAREAFPLSGLPDAPTEFVSWMAKQGYSKQWSNAYWHIHFRYVPINTLYELFHRGFITLQELSTYLTIEDLAPFKRPGQTKTDVELAVEASYALLPRIDLRFGWFTGALTDAEVKALYEKYGLKAEDATKELGIQKARILEPYRRGYLATLQLAYRRGKITADAFRSKVVAEKFPGEVADWLIKSEDLRSSLGAGVESVAEDRALTKSDLIRLYRRDLIDQARLKSELVNLNYSAAEIALLVADADYQAPVEAKETVKIVSVSDLEALYKSGLRSKETIIADLRYKHYDEESNRLLLLLWDREIAEAAKKTPTIISVSDLEKLYKMGARDRATLVADLKYQNWDNESIIILLDLWDREVKAQAKPAPTPEPPRTISASEALEAYEKGLKDEAWTRAQLLAQNYAAARIDLLIQAVKAKISQEGAAAAAKPFMYTVAQANDLFEHGLYTEANYRFALKSLGIPDVNISEQLQLVKEKLKKPAAKPEEISLSNLQFAWENGLIDDASLVSRIGAMGYSSVDAALMTQLTKARALENERNRMVTVLEARFKIGLGTEADVRSKLGALGYIAERQDIILETWRLERDTENLKDTEDALVLAYRNGQRSREFVMGYMTTVLGIDADVADAKLLIEDVRLVGKAT